MNKSKANDTSFRPGQSGNPSGRPRTSDAPTNIAETRACIAEEYAKAKPKKDRLRALEALLASFDQEASRKARAEAQAPSIPAGEMSTNTVVINALRAKVEMERKLKAAEDQISKHDMAMRDLRVQCRADYETSLAALQKELADARRAHAACEQDNVRLRTSVEAQELSNLRQKVRELQTQAQELDRIKKAALAMLDKMTYIEINQELQRLKEAHPSGDFPISVQLRRTDLIHAKLMVLKQMTDAEKILALEKGEL